MSTGTQVEVVMPQMGVSVSEGTITRWLKQAGDSVALDEPLLEISTDKVDTEVPSPGEGIVAEIRVQEGETVEVGTVLAVIGAAGAAPAAPAEPAAPLQEETPAAEEAAAPVACAVGCHRARRHCARRAAGCPRRAACLDCPGRGAERERQDIRLARRRADRRPARGRPERRHRDGSGRPCDEEGHPCVHRVRRRRAAACCGSTRCGRRSRRRSGACRRAQPAPVEVAAAAAPPASPARTSCARSCGSGARPRSGSRRACSARARCGQARSRSR